MNVWMDIAIPLIVTCAALIICNIVALWLIYSSKAENSRLHLKNGGLIIANADLELELEKTTTERDSLRLQLDEALKPRTRAKPTAKPPKEEV